MARRRRRWLRRFMVLGGIAAFMRWREDRMARNARAHALRDRL